MIIPTMESELRMTLMQLSETKHELTAAREELKAVTKQRDEMTLRWELTNDSLFDKRALADRLAEALRNIKNELGVPQPEYPAPIANAVKIADEALQSLNQPTEP
jgi:uncharacterized coiled-coil DUF342 family protein